MVRWGPSFCKGVPSQRRASPIFIWMDISLRSRLLDVVADAAIISEVRGKSETSEQNPFFLQQNGRSQMLKKGVWPAGCFRS